MCRQEARLQSERRRRPLAKLFPGQTRRERHPGDEEGFLWMNSALWSLSSKAGGDIQALHKPSLDVGLGR